MRSFGGVGIPPHEVTACADTDYKSSLSFVGASARITEQCKNACVLETESAGHRVIIVANYISNIATASGEKCS